MHIPLQWNHKFLDLDQTGIFLLRKTVQNGTSIAHKGAIDVQLGLAKSQSVYYEQMISLGFLSMCQHQSVKDVGAKRERG